MTAKQRQSTFQHWQSVIMRETRDLPSLERVGAMALQDRDVRSDAALESMIRTHLAQRRADIERDTRNNAPAARPAGKPRDFACGSRGVRENREPRAESQSAPPVPKSPTPDPARLVFDELAEIFRNALARGDEREAGAAYDNLRVHQQEHRGVVPAAGLAEYEQRLARLRTRLEEFRVQIAALLRQAVAASRSGDEQSATALLRRLAAIHVNYPNLLDAMHLEEARADVLQASEQHDDSATARRLEQRERAVAREIKRIAIAVQRVYREVCAAPATREAVRDARATYKQARQDVRAHGPEWLAGLVLELGDLLAEWRLPSQAARQQIDTFLERVQIGMRRIRAAVARIDSKLDEVDDSRAEPP
jgi:hypothetical protein